MNIILKIGVRNLMRQKRRNLLLGSGIAFGMCLLVLATAIGSGISDLLLNKMVTSFSGHIFVTMSEKNDKKWDIIRDKERIEQSIMEHVEGVKLIREKIEVYGKALGNGKTMYVNVVGMDPNAEMFRGTPVLAGSLEDLTNPAIDYPLALYQPMAEQLNVQVNDVVRMRTESVYGQSQTATFTVVAVMDTLNPFFNKLMYCPLEKLKPLLGYELHETNSFQIILDHMTDFNQLLERADQLHAALQPGVAGYMGTVHARGKDENITVVAVAPDAEAQSLLRDHLNVAAGSLEDTLNDEQAVILSQKTAETLGVGIGDEVTTQYTARFGEDTSSYIFRVGAIFAANAVMTPDIMVAHVEHLYDTVFPVPPRNPAQMSQDSAVFPALLKEWTLLDRTTDQDASERKYRELRAQGWRGAILDVQTLHEVAGEVLDFENAIKLITVVGVVTLFFIIQIGVVNTLRMSIRERTREIGTVRAIGMQCGDVLKSFVTEAVLLTVFACLVGIVAGLGLMQVFSLFSIDTRGSEMGFFLLNNHLYFVAQLDELLINFVIIVGIAFLTAYLPARSAAQLSVVNALRHYE